MPNFRKKPVVIEAFSWRGQTNLLPEIPTWFVDAILAGTISATDDQALAIKTLEGTMRADVNDMIIRGVKGEIYPCKPDVFAASYDSVPEALGDHAPCFGVR